MQTPHSDPCGDTASTGATPLPGPEAEGDPSPAAPAVAAAELARVSDAFRAIAEKHQAYLRRIARRFTGNRETAEDLVQETLARAWQCFAAFERGTNARAWLATILTRLFYDHIRHVRVTRNAEPELMRFASAGLDTAMLDVPDEKLWEAMRALDPDLRAVVERCYMQDRSYKQIAEELGLPTGTIGTRLKRARERLKQILIATDDDIAARR